MEFQFTRSLVIFIEMRDFCIAIIEMKFHSFEIFINIIIISDEHQRLKHYTVFCTYTLFWFREINHKCWVKFTWNAMRNVLLNQTKYFASFCFCSSTKRFVNKTAFSNCNMALFSSIWHILWITSNRAYFQIKALSQNWLITSDLESES